MVHFKEFLPADPWNDMVVQRALAEVDTDVLATALVNLPDDIRAIFYRNMSRRASALVVDDIEARQGVRPARIEAARELITQVLRKHATSAADEKPAAGAGVLPEIAVDSSEAIVSTFSRLASYVRKHGVLPLERLESTINHPLLLKGIEFLVDGSDPLLTRSILERYKETLLQQAKARLDMIVDGIDCLAERNHPYLVEQKLRAHSAQDAPRG